MHSSLFENLNNYEKFMRTIETILEKFLDTWLLLGNSITKTEVYRKAIKFLVHWKSQIPKRYKRSAINGDLYRSWIISSIIDHEKNEIRSKFSSAGYPVRFVVNSVINDIESKKQSYPVIYLMILNQSLLF